jgi:glycosyltransferase involved in cell wall biosynthesis
LIGANVSLKTVLVNIYPLDYNGGLEIFSRAYLALNNEVEYIYANQYMAFNKVKIFSLTILLYKCILFKLKNKNVFFLFCGLTGILSFFFRKSATIYHGTNKNIINNNGVIGLKKIYYYLEILPIEYLSVQVQKNNIFVSQKCMDEFRRYYQVNSGCVIHNPVLDDFVLTENPYDNSVLNIVYFGRWEVQKGIDILENLFIYFTNLPVRFHVISQTNIKRKFSSNVIFYGEKKHSELATYLKYSDVVVLPSISEGFGYAILESTLLSKLVLTNAVGVAPEIAEIYPNLKIMENGEDYINMINMILSKKYIRCNEFDRSSVISAYNNKVIKLYNDLVIKLSNTIC